MRKKILWRDHFAEKRNQRLARKSGYFLGIGHKLRHTSEAESRGQRFVGTIGNLDFCCEAEGEAKALKNRVTLFLEVSLMKPKKLFGFENKKSPWISGRSQVDISPISSFFASHSLSRRKNSHSVFWREISKWFLSIDFIFGFLFEHQLYNLIEFSEIIFVKWFIGKLWKHEDHFWNVSLDKKIIKIWCSLSNLFFEPVWKFKTLNKKSYFGRSSFLVTNSWTAFDISFRFSVKIFHLGSQILFLKTKWPW